MQVADERNEEVRDQLSSEVLSWSRCGKGAVKGRGNRGDCGNREQGGGRGNPCRGEAVLGRGKRWSATNQQ